MIHSGDEKEILVYELSRFPRGPFAAGGKFDVSLNVPLNGPIVLTQRDINPSEIVIPIFFLIFFTYPSS
jgi:hypothetical protein